MDMKVACSPAKAVELLPVVDICKAAVDRCIGMNHPSDRLNRKYRRFGKLYQAAPEIAYIN